MGLRKAPEGGSENAQRGGGKLPPQSYEEVVAAAKESVSLAEVGINAVRMRKTMTGGVILVVPEDQKREEAAALAARLIQTLGPIKVRVATPFRAAEARVTRIDIAV